MAYERMLTILNKNKVTGNLDYVDNAGNKAMIVLKFTAKGAATE